MFAKCLYSADCRIENTFGKPWLEYRPLQSMDEVYAALAVLDKDIHSLMVISEARGDPEDEEETFWGGRAMIVAGGKQNQYFCRAYIKDEPGCPYLVGVKWGAPRTPETVWVRVGEPEEVQRYRIIGIEEARVALEAFAKRGVLTDELEWEPELLL